MRTEPLPLVSILDARPCRLGEGPSYEAETDTLFWFDILDQKMLERRFADGLTLAHDLPFMASAVFTVDEARQLVLSEHGFHLRDRKTGRLTLHTAVEADNPATRSNDARTHPCGAVWFGTMGKDEGAGAGAIYHFHRGSVSRLYADITVPNSICFSPDGRTAYYTDTATHRLMRVSIDPATALPIGGPDIFFESKGEGWIDGSVCDANGNVWNARWGAGALVCHAPDGRIVRTLVIPGSPQTSCPAFIGTNLDRFAVTSASKQLSEAALAAAPDAGRTFFIDVPVMGRPEPRVLI